MIKRYLVIAVLVFSLLPFHKAIAEKEQIGIVNFIGQVWNNNPVIKEGESLVEKAKAEQKAAARWKYNPEISYDEEDIAGEKKTRVLGISQTIDWNGKAKSSGVVAEFELNAVIAELANTKQNIAVGVLSSLFDYNRASNILGLSIRRTELMQKFSNLAENSFKAGDIDKGEYNLAKLAFSEAMISQADAQMSVSEAKQILENSIGYSFMDYPVLPTDLPDIDKVINEEKLVMRLPSIVVLSERERAAKAAIKQAKKNRLADPSFGISGGQDTGSDLVGFSVSLPLNVFNSYAAEVDVAKQNYLAKGKVLKTALYASKTKLQSSHRNYISSKKAWENWSDGGANALAEQVNILDRKFKVGELSATDYLVQIKQALDTEQASLELYGKVWNSWFTWLASSGQVEQWIKNLEGLK